MYHPTATRRAKVIQEAAAKRQKEKLQKEREELVKSLESEILAHEHDSIRASWNAGINRAIEVVKEGLS